jgi:galactose oxidase
VAAGTEAGEWSQPFSWPIVAVHMMLLPNGRVLSIGRTGTPQVWNPATGAFTAVPAPAWLFCAGHTLLPDGRVFLAGGHIQDNRGLPNITFFSGTSTWTSGAPMARGRWYPTTTTMGNGDVVILAGRDEAGVVVTVPEVWSNGSLRRLTGAPQSLPYYPRAFLAPDGRLYSAGPTRPTRFLSLGGSGSWTKGPTHLFGSREYGSAVMYDDGKILYAGGSRTTNTAEVIDLNRATPAWSWTGSMAFARRHLNLTALPTGEVLATGGVGGTTFNDLSVPVRAAEIWNPTNGQWTTLASNAVTRGYHGTSLLLPDGRVLNAGSGNGAGARDERNAELFSPPYLFRGARPSITSAPAEVGYGAQFRLLTPQAAAIAQVSLIRLGAVTHAFDENQRFQRLAFTADATGLTVTAPSSPNRAPPGHYMVFVMNQAGAPSVARIIRIR